MGMRELCSKRYLCQSDIQFGQFQGRKTSLQDNNIIHFYRKGLSPFVLFLLYNIKLDTTFTTRIKNNPHGYSRD